MKKLKITNPLVYDAIGDLSSAISDLCLFGTFDEAPEVADEDDSSKRTIDPRMPHPVSSMTLMSLFEHCGNLEELVWASACPPPDGLFEVGFDAIV